MYKKRSDFFDSSFVYFLIISCFVIIRIISSTFKISSELGYVLNTTIQVGLMFSLPVFVYSSLRKQKLKTTFDRYGFKKISVKSIIYSILIGIVVYFVTIFIATFFSAILALFGYESSSSGSVIKNFPVWLLFVELFFTAILPGICEEVAHRGMLLSTYKKLGVKKAIVLTGLLFGLMHMNIDQFFYTSLIGMFLGFLVLFSGSIYPAMIIHFMNNAISTFMSFSSANNLPFSTHLNNFINLMFSQGPLLGVVMMFFTVLTLCTVILFLTGALIKDTRIKYFSNMADRVVKNKLRQELMEGIGGEEEDEEVDDDEVQITANVISQNRLFSIVLKSEELDYSAYRITFKDKVFLYVNLFMGVAVTIFTFIWGIL